MLVRLALLSLALASRALGQDCQVFQEAACPLSEDNIIGLIEDMPSAGGCQAQCREHGECAYFTYLYNSGCYLLLACDPMEACSGCISGPTEPDFDSCASTSAPPTTAPPPPSTTAPPPTPSPLPCDVDPGFVCEVLEGTLIAHIEHIRLPTDCQALCQNHADCARWSHWLEGAPPHEHWGHCTLHTECSLTDRECFEADQHECREGPRPGPHKCVCLSGGNEPDLDDCGDPRPTPTPPIPCWDDFFPGSRCEEHENTIEHIEHISRRSDCQAVCQNNPDCEFFTHFMDEHGNHGHCFLHWNCDQLTDRECGDCHVRPGHCGCFAGPAWPDLDDCSEPPY